MRIVAATAVTLTVLLVPAVGASKPPKGWEPRPTRTAPEYNDLAGPEHFYVLSGPYGDLAKKVRANQDRYFGGDGLAIADIQMGGDTVAGITYGANAEGREALLALAWQVSGGWYVTPAIARSHKNIPLYFDGSPSLRRVVLGPDGLEATEIRASFLVREKPSHDVVVLCVDTPKPACTRQLGLDIGAGKVDAEVKYPGDGTIVLSVTARHAREATAHHKPLTRTFEPFRN